MNKGIVYKLYHKLTAQELYVGSTTMSRAERLGKHITESKGIKNNSSLMQMIRRSDPDDLCIEEVEKVEFEHKDELKTREEYWINELGASLNDRKAIRTEQENYDIRKEARLKLYKTNQESTNRIRERNRKFNASDYYKTFRKFNYRIRQIKKNYSPILVRSFDILVDIVE